ncbi:hypothetical protein [Pedobacter jejuensis]|uniref:hypothetical protein n=1 Tax=Pedobacter jejuensis TaxID=1268550 RepID=UPI00142E30CC|nr:hypothetical protein [Pedobacter jejuensis]
MSIDAPYHLHLVWYNINITGRRRKPSKGNFTGRRRPKVKIGEGILPGYFCETSPNKEDANNYYL